MLPVGPPAMLRWVGLEMAPGDAVPDRRLRSRPNAQAGCVAVDALRSV